MELASELIGRARELRPVIARRAAATEANRAPLDETIRDLCDADLMQILTPRRYGGHELHVDTMVEVARTLATACPSTGWITAFYIGHNWLHAVFPEKAQHEAFADRPYQLSSGQIAPTATAVRVPGGFEVSGRQAWSSGVAHAEWIFFTGMLSEDGQKPAPWMFCIPRSDVEVIDTWFIAGMKGTGSSDVAVERVFVPDHRGVPFLSLLDGTHWGSRTHDSPLYRLPAITVLGFETIGVLAGALRGAAEEMQRLTRERIASYTGASVAAKPAAQMRVGRAFATAEAVDLMVAEATSWVVGLPAGSDIAVEDRARLKMRSALVTAMACDGVNDIIHGAGGNAFRDGAALQRFFRDVNVLRTHASLDIEPSSEIYGRVLLGMEPGAPV